MELEGKFDAVCSSYIPKYVDPDKLLERITPHLNPGGVVALHDFTYPHGRIAQGIWRTYMSIMSRLAKRAFPAWAHLFQDELTSLIIKSKWPRRYREAFARHGYKDISMHTLTHRSATIVSAKK